MFLRKQVRVVFVGVFFSLGCDGGADVNDDSSKENAVSDDGLDGCSYVCTFDEEDCISGLQGTPVPGVCTENQTCCFVSNGDGQSPENNNGNNTNLDLDSDGVPDGSQGGDDGSAVSNNDSQDSVQENDNHSGSNNGGDADADADADADSDSDADNDSDADGDGHTDHNGGSEGAAGDSSDDNVEAVTDIEVEVENVAVRVHHDNPFASATKWYVNEWWAENAIASGGEAIADVSTGVWMDRIAAIEPYKDQTPNEDFGLRQHLDAALAQGADLFMFVVYDLPGRDCAAEASNGELPATAAGMAEYKKEYIGRIVQILSDGAYAAISIVAIIEIDSLPNLVTNAEKAACTTVNNSSPYGYTEGVRFALTQFKKLPNVHSYVDAAHAGWLGWDERFSEASTFVADVIAGGNHAGPTSAPGWDAINGFITNTSNYTPLEEPYLQDPNASTNGDEPLMSAVFFDWNPVFGELQFAKLWREAMIQHGAGEDLGMLIDTGRNGWGGPDRPTGSSSATAPDQIVDESRIDRRPHRGSWCNQRGGIGERPQANPAGQSHIDAYVWVKPPGESDGISTADFEVDPNDKNKKYDPMCGPNDTNRYAEEAESTRGQGIGTGAMDGAPHAGRWYTKGFQVLCDNAEPPLPAR